MEEYRESSGHSSVVPNLNHDVLTEIFYRLPAEPLNKFRSVSKSFRSLIEDPHFVNLHLTKTFTKNPKKQIFLSYDKSPCYTYNDFPVCNLDLTAKTIVQDNRIKFPFKSKNGYLRIVGSSNGLLCFFDTNYYSCMGMLFLWNPTLRKANILPNPHLSRRIVDKCSHVVAGFAFVSKISDFKVVLIMYKLGTRRNPTVLVYTLEEARWKKIDALVPCYMPNSWSENVLFNESIHWVAVEAENIDNIQYKIMYFNMSNEVFGEFELPINIDFIYLIDPNYIAPKLSASSSGESLSLFSFSNGQWDLWLMKEYCVVGSWEKKYTISVSMVHSPLRCMDKGHVLVVMKNGNLAFFDPESKECKEMGICGEPNSFCVAGYTESLALLHSCRLSKHKRKREKNEAVNKRQKVGSGKRVY